jgi:hypothetical protein
MYVVDWEPPASDEFAVISMMHVDRWAEINAADGDLDKKLRRDPLLFSQPVAEGLRRINRAPLVIYFSVEGKVVHVEKVRWIG